MYPEDLYLNDEKKAIQKLLRDFTDKEIIPVRKQLEEEKDFKTADKLFKKLKDIGIQSHFVPEEYGGNGCTSAIDVAIVCEELARGDAGMALQQVISSAAPWSVLAAAENKTLLDIMGPQWCGEDVMSFGTVFTEPEGGCDAEWTDMAGKTLRTTAKLEGDEYVINGQKGWPANAGRVPGWIEVACTTDPSLGREGVAVMFIPVPYPGLSFGKQEEKMGFRSARNCTIYFDNVRVPKGYRLSGPGMDANLYYGGILTAARFTSPGMDIGVAQAAFDLALEYTGKRMGGGKKVRDHSIIKGILADMAIGIKTARAALMNVGWQLDHPEVYGPPWSQEMMAKVCMVRIYANKVVQMVASKGVELMGAAGVSEDYFMEKFYRDAKITSVWLAGVQVNKFEIAKAYYD